MNAAEIAKALCGIKTGNGWSARCPAHDDREPSLSISEGVDRKILLHCFTGCEQAIVIAALKSRGLWGRSDHNWPQYPAQRVAGLAKPDHDDAKRSMAALAIWQLAQAAQGTLVEIYLRSRGLLLTPPPSLRLHAGLKHPSGGNWPAMVALVTRGTDDEPLAIHRTFLAHDGVGKAPVDPQKMMLGPCRGGAVRLAGSGDVLMIGEGLETCLTAMQATGKTAWAALSTSGMRTLELPADIRDVIVLADGDVPGEAAAKDCALRWKREGRRVRIARPPRNSDFNDMLASKATVRGEKSYG